MKLRTRPLAFLALAALAAAPPALSLLEPRVLAQDEEEADDEDPRELAKDLVELGRPLVESGSYFDAIRKLRKAVKADPANVEAALLLSEAYEQSGEPGKALKTVEALGASGTTASRTRLAELMLASGDSRAEKLLDTILSNDEDAIPARRLRAALYEDTGRREEALAEYVQVNKLWGSLQKQATADDDLAEARARLGIYRLTDEYRVKGEYVDLNPIIERIGDALKKQPRMLELRIEAGELYLASQNGQDDLDAKKQYKKALELNPQYAPAIFGLARQLAFRFDDLAARREAERALRSNPAHVGALLFLAQMDLGDGRYGPAQKRIDEALALNPVHAEARATRAALMYLRGDFEDYEAEVAAILERNRYASIAYSVLASVCEEQRRFREAFELAQRAIETDARDWPSYFLAGRNALNIGEDALAKEYLERAEKDDPFHNLYRKNFLSLFNNIRTYATRKDDRFVVRLPAREDTPYFPLLRRALGWSADLLEQRWNVELEDPTFISVFDQQEHFATRTIGLPGFPALGACFGRVVTLDSPRALPPGQFGWRAVLHHEMAHCITLQLSKGRVPRWLTEGASVYEERKVSPVWNREMERVLIDAIASDEVLTLENVNAAFRGPRVLYAYYQGGLMCEFIERDFGFDALRELVRLYGEEKHTPAAVREALGVSPDEFDARFLAFAKEYVADIRVLPRPSSGKMARLKRHLRRQKDDGEAWILYAAGHAARRDRAASLAAIAQAVKLLPEDGRIPAIRGYLAFHGRSKSRAVQHAEEAIAKGADLYEMRMILGGFYRDEEKDLATAETHYRRAIELFPYQKGPGDPRLALSKLLLEAGETRLDEYVQVLRDHTDIDEDDWQTRLQLVEIYETRGRTDQQLEMLEQIRDICPLPNVGPWKVQPPPRPFERSLAVDLHSRLGDLYSELGRAAPRHEDAEASYRMAVAVARMDLGEGGSAPLSGPELSDLIVRHAQSLRALGRSEDALQALRDALREDPENEDALELQRRLQQ